MKKIILFISFLFILSCNDKKKIESKIELKDTINQKTETIKPITYKKKKIDIHKINSNDSLLRHIFFVSFEGMVYTMFDINEVVFVFGFNSCEYTFPIQNKGNEILIAWNKDDYSCNYKSGLDKNYNVKQPHKGDVFAEVSPYNDTVIKINYLYPEFIQKLNERGRTNDLAIDTLFPKLFVIANR